MDKRLFFIFFSFFLFASFFSIAFAANVPTLKPCLNDLSGVVDAQSRADITLICNKLYADRAVEVAVLILPTTDGEDIADFAVRTFEKNGIGKKGEDNGLLLVIASKDRSYWFTTGYGLEGVLPDGRLGTIGRQKLVPKLKNGDYGGGVKDSLAECARYIMGGYAASGAGGKPMFEPWQMILIFLVMFIIFCGVALAFGMFLTKYVKSLPSSGTGGYYGGYGGYHGSGGFGGHSGGGGWSGGGSFGGGHTGGGGAGGRF